MNGSCSERGRPRPAPALAVEVPATADQLATQAAESPWAEYKVCWLCGRRQEGAAPCEREEKVWEALEGQGRRAPFGETAVCKGCCIAALDGHECPWWELCWRD